MPFLRVFWVVGLAIPFFFLPFWWALFALLFVAVLSPLMSMLLYAPLRRFVASRPNIRSFITGGIESIVFLVFYCLITKKLNIPHYFLLSVILMYSINQVNRAYRYRDNLETDELQELIGFFVITIPGVILLFAV